MLACFCFSFRFALLTFVARHVTVVSACRDKCTEAIINVARTEVIPLSFYAGSRKLYKLREEKQDYLSNRPAKINKKATLGKPAVLSLASWLGGSNCAGPAVFPMGGGGNSAGSAE